MSLARTLRSPLPWSTLALASLLAADGLSAAPQATQQPSFRSTVDLVAVEVQVVDGDGRPISRLNPDSFDVTIGGKRRRVLSADYIKTTSPDGPAVTREGAGPATPAAWPTSDDGPARGRVYVLAFDLASLNVADSRAMVASSRSFIDRLQPEDAVGLYTFPVGPRMEPTVNHAAVRAKIDTVVGSRQPLLGEYNLTPSEIIDINAETARDALINARRTPQGAPLAGDANSALRRVQQRECRDVDLQVPCVDGIIQEAQSMGLYLEGRATESLNGLRGVIRLLTAYEGRKTLVVFSAGMVSSDRPGGRPDVVDVAKALGQDAAATNTTIYTIHVDTAELRANSAENARTDRIPPNRARDNAVGRRMLDEFSGASGGTLMRVITGSGESALTRVLRETSSHYLLGIEPGEADRDGKIRELRVKVHQPNVTVRSRLGVVIPPKRS